MAAVPEMTVPVTVVMNVVLTADDGVGVTHVEPDDELRSLLLVVAKAALAKVRADAGDN